MTCAKVTISGADDQVNPKDLVELSNLYPNVEFGILYSIKRQGTPRYPTDKWINSLAGLGLNLSLHVCGESARQVMSGFCLPSFCDIRGFFQRIQVNGYNVGGIHKILSLAPPGLEFILQCRAEDTLKAFAVDAAVLNNIPLRKASVLFDPSGGRGKENMVFPSTPAGCKLGFAGGISPDNVAMVLVRIGDREPYWIDMESKVRTNDQFDLDKVNRVLEIVKDSRLFL